jgi:adenosylcobinamide-GDP ribazoletransferase
MNGDQSIAGQLGALLDEVKAALAFLTRIPPAMLGVDARPDLANASRVFPVAGAIIGAAGGAVMVAAWLVGLPPFVAAILGVATTLALTGARHEGDLAATADSLAGGTRERKLEILADARVGRLGAVAIAVTLLARVAALAAIWPRGPLAAAGALIAGEAVSRAAVVRLWHDLPAARSSEAAAEPAPPDHTAMLTALAAALLIVAVTALPAVGWQATVLALVLSAPAVYVVTRLVARSIGGRTSESLGACQQVALAAFLVGASAG